MLALGLWFFLSISAVASILLALMLSGFRAAILGVSLGLAVMLLVLAFTKGGF